MENETLESESANTLATAVKAAAAFTLIAVAASKGVSKVVRWNRARKSVTVETTTPNE